MADIVITVTVHLIIVTIPTVVVAILLIGSAFYRLTTSNTKFNAGFHNRIVSLIAHLK